MLYGKKAATMTPDLAGKKIGLDEARVVRANAIHLGEVAARE